MLGSAPKGHGAETSVTIESPEAFRSLLAKDAGRAWQVFIDECTPTLLALIERAGIARHDEAMEVYVLVCRRLSANDCARLSRWNPDRGPLGAWLAVVVRHVIVDWIRSRAGRRRLFGVVKRLSKRDQRVFELYYWEGYRPAEIAEDLGAGSGQAADVSDVLDALERIDVSLTDRHRRELLAMAARSRTAASLDGDEDGAPEVPDRAPDPEARLHIRQTEHELAAALSELPPEDAAIVRLRYLEGLSLSEVQRALHAGRLTERRVKGILDALRARLSRVQAGEGAAGPP